MSDVIHKNTPPKETHKGRAQTIILTMACQATQGVSLAGLPLLLPLIRQDLGLSFVQAGTLASASLLVYALMQIPAGYLADRYSPRRLVAVGTLGLMGLSVILAFIQQYWQLLGIQFLWGFFASFIFTPAMSVYINWFSSGRRTTATALPLIGPSVGIFIINLVFPLIANHFDDSWRMPFIIFGAAGILCAFGLWLFGKETTSKRRLPSLNMALVRELLRYKQVWVCNGIQFVRFGIVQGLSFWLPSLLIDEKNFPLQTAGVIIAVQALILAPGNLLGAYFADKFNKPVPVIGVSMVMLGITSALMVNLNSIWLITAVIFINAVFMQMYFGPLFTLAVEKLGPEKTGISNGFGNMFAIFGGLSAAYLMGYLKDATDSFAWGFYSVCILCAFGLILTFVLQRVRGARTAKAAARAEN